MGRGGGKQGGERGDRSIKKVGPVAEEVLPQRRLFGVDKILVISRKLEQLRSGVCRFYGINNGQQKETTRAK